MPRFIFRVTPRPKLVMCVSLGRFAPRPTTNTDTQTLILPVAFKIRASRRRKMFGSLHSLPAGDLHRPPKGMPQSPSVLMSRGPLNSTACTTGHPEDLTRSPPPYIELPLRPPPSTSQGNAATALLNGSQVWPDCNTRTLFEQSGAGRQKYDHIAQSGLMMHGTGHRWRFGP